VLKTIAYFTEFISWIEPSRPKHGFQALGVSARQLPTNHEHVGEIRLTPPLASLPPGQQD
jgi:hypothetical protein